MGRNVKFIGALVALVAIQGCAGVPSTAASRPQDTEVAATATVSPLPNSPTPAEPVAATPAPTETVTGVAITRIPVAPTSSPTPASPPTASRPPPVSPSPSAQVATNAVISPQALPAVNLARADLSKRAKVGTDAIAVTAVTSATWPDGSLGCPRPGFMYSQIVTPGYRIVLTAGTQIYEYHSDRGTRVTLCSPIEP